jgi:hypothetical protein
MLYILISELKIWMQHIRNGTELPELHRDDHYDFQRQQSYNVNVTILPNDRLVLYYFYILYIYIFCIFIYFRFSIVFGTL